MGLSRLFPADTEMRLLELNSEPAILILGGGIPFRTFSFRIEHGQVVNSYAVANPEKLTGLR